MKKVIGYAMIYIPTILIWGYIITHDIEAFLFLLGLLVIVLGWILLAVYLITKD